MSLIHRVCICFKCKEYIPIHNGNIQSSIRERKFLFEHRIHTTQIVNRDELTSEYKVVS